MSKKTKQNDWGYDIKGIEKQMKNYTRNQWGTIDVAFYPTINEFSSMDEYESYVNVLIKGLRKELSDSKKTLKELSIAFKFFSHEKLREMNFIQFIFNLIMWRPYITFDIPVTEKDIFNPEIFHNRKYEEYFNNFAEFHRDKFTMAEFSEALFHVQADMNKLVVSVGPIFGNSISIYDMAKMAARNKEIDAIMHTEVNLDNFQVHEVEEYLISVTERFLNILLNEDDKNNPLKPFIRARTGVNRHQVQETFIHLGFKPDNDGNTIPLTTNSNLVTDGLKSPEAIFIDSKGGRKAAIMQKGVASAGYFGRHSAFVTSNITLNEDPNYSCDTVNLFKVKITSQRELESFEGRFRKIGHKKYEVIKRTDKHLIGTEIEIRSPVTCASKENKICKVCYGTLYNVNYGIHAGLYAAIDTNEDKTQLGLSAKHALETKSEEIEIVDDNFFLLNQNGWLFTLNPNINRDKYEVIFEYSDVMMENPADYDRYDNYYIGRIVFRNKQTGETFEVYEKHDNHLHFSKQMYMILSEMKFFSLDKGESLAVPLSEFSVDEPFLFLRITNEELTKPIRELTRFIQKGKKPLKEVGDYNEYIIKLNKLFRQGGMNIPSVHIEMIIRNLIRSKDNDLDIPDWSVTQTPDMYKMVSLNEAAISSNSVIAGLMFEQVKKQLHAIKTYRKRGSSIHSLLFINE